VRTILGPPALALARRGLALERAAMITLRRDAYAVPPGPTLGLALGERTTYRPGAWLLDTFERDALGETYAAWGGTAGLTLEAGGVTAAVGPGGMVTHPLELPRDAWAAIQIGALAGDAEVGLLLRAAADTADGYGITATPSVTRVARLDAGVATSLASVATAWRAGQMLRAVWAWDALRVYQDTILVAQVTEGSRRLAGRAGVTARRGDAGAAATITAFLGGEARQEWLGDGLDLGDLQRVLGQPMTFDLTLSNVAPMGGADRFAALLRHGLNTVDTYDLDRGSVRVLTVIDAQSPPLTAGLGVIDGVAEITEDRVRLACRGRDAFLTPQLAAGPVTYLPGPPPGGLTPLPAEPCAPSTPPEIIPGDPPPEPVDPVDPVDPAHAEGVGPEAPPVPPVPPAPPLLGLWMFETGYATTPEGTEVPVSDGVDHGEVGIVSGGSVTPWMMNGPDDAGADSVVLCQNHYPAVVTADAGKQTLRWMYRGPDVVGTHLTVPQTLHGGYPGLTLNMRRFTESGLPPATPPELCHFAAVTVRVVEYSGAGISTVADLAAFQPGRLLPSQMPMRVQTLATFTFPGATVTMGYNVLNQYLDLALDAIPLNRFAGPQIIGLEFDPVFAGHVDADNSYTGIEIFALYGSDPALGWTKKSVHPEGV
jgi:hypothetical protein